MLALTLITSPETIRALAGTLMAVGTRRIEAFRAHNRYAPECRRGPVPSVCKKSMEQDLVIDYCGKRPYGWFERKRRRSLSIVLLSRPLGSALRPPTDRTATNTGVVPRGVILPGCRRDATSVEARRRRSSLGYFTDRVCRAAEPHDQARLKTSGRADGFAFQGEFVDTASISTPGLLWA